MERELPLVNEPRSRGENSPQPCHDHVVRGTPPLARGNRLMRDSRNPPATGTSPRVCGRNRGGFSAPKSLGRNFPTRVGETLPTRGNMFSFPNLASLATSKVRGFYCNQSRVTSYFDGFLLH